MKLDSLLSGTTFRRTLVCVALGAAYASASAANLPPFTLNPAGSLPPLAGAPLTADNIVISDFSTVRLSGSTFTDSGFLAVQSFQLGGANVVLDGLNSTYGLYFDFTGAGTTTPGNPFSIGTSGQINTLSYTLYGYNGAPATFGFDGADNPTTSVSSGSRIALATGSLLPGAGQGTVGTSPVSPSFLAFASANLSFVPTSNAGTFFLDPRPFYNVAVSSFINSSSEISAVAGGYANGFRITNGGGTVNFASPVPEPETYALFLAGLGALGWVARRRRKQ